MKNFVCTILLLVTFGFSNNVEAEVKDTCKQNPISINLKPQIVNKLVDCFIKSEFYDLAIFCEGYVEFGFVKDSLIHYDSGTEYKALSNLNDFFRGLNYSRFKVMGGINIHGEDVFVTRVFLSEAEDYYLDVYFTLDKKQAIYSIIIIV